MLNHSSNSKSNILLIVTGSIAAYKALDLVSALKKTNHIIEVVLTNSALEFVKPLSFRSLGAKVIKDDLFDIEKEMTMGHIELSRKSDLIIIYPATANFIATLSSGRADRLSSAIILASNKQVFLAPAMNVEMWHNKITQENLSKLESNQIEILYPEQGMLACGEEGEGKAMKPEMVVEVIDDYLSNKNKLSGKKILITAGGTIEKIDPVRYISNFSSGKQGVEIAKKCKEYGADVTLIIGKTSCRIPNNVNVIKINSAIEMKDEVEKSIKATKYDYMFMTAAICDYAVSNIEDHKIKKDSNTKMILELEKNPDILKFVCNHQARPKTVIGFAAETENLIEHASKKLTNKACDYIVANNVKDHKVFGSDDNVITLIGNNITSEPYSGSKSKIANFLISKIIKF